MLFIILVVLMLATLAGGGWGYSRWGYVGMSPAAVLLAVVVVLYFTGHLSLR